MADLSSNRQTELAHQYRLMTELELYSLVADWHALTEEARDALAAEFDKRKLNFAVPHESAEDDLPDYRDLVTIRSYRDLSEAIVARGVIDSSGIFCLLKDENLVRLDWQVSNMIGGIRLQVAASDVEAAEAVLAQPIPDIIELADGSNFEQPRCPRCRSTNISYERSSRKAALASLHLFAFPLPRGSASWTCHDCSLHWPDTQEA